MAGVPASLTEILEGWQNATLDEIHKAVPGVIVEYDADRNVAQVKPSVAQSFFSRDGEREYVELPEMLGVPIVFPRFGPYTLTFPVKKGDRVLLLFLDEGIAEWHKGGDEVARPLAPWRHSACWPVAIPGLYPMGEPMSLETADKAARAAGPVFGEHNGPCRIELVPGATDADDRIKLHADAVDFVANAAKVDALIAALKAAVTGTTIVAGDGGAALKTALKGALDAATSVACTKTKAK